MTNMFRQCICEDFVDMHPGDEVERTKLERLKKIFTDMYVIYDVRPEGYLLRFNSLLYELLFTLIHSYSEKLLQRDFERDDKYFNRLKDIMDFIDENHAYGISTAVIAEKVAVMYLKPRNGIDEHHRKVLGCRLRGA